MTKHRVLVGFCAIALLAARARSQNPIQTIFTTCPPSNWVATERQVTFPARLIGDSNGAPAKRPVQNARDSVAFVVDTLGVPDTGTIRILPQRDSLLASRARADVGRWRFTPAIASGCRVRQRVAVPYQGGPGQ